MAYVAPTVADIKTHFPQFAAVSDAVIQYDIDLTTSVVDESWFETDYTRARELLTAHYLTLDGQGTSTDAEMAGQGLSGVTRLKSASLDVSFSASAADTNSGSEYDTTSFGRRFLTLLRKNKGGPRIAAGGHGCVAGQATDMPWAYRTGGFGL